MESEKPKGRERAERTEARKVDKRIVTGMANSLRTEILATLNERAASATELSKELGVPFDKVSYEMSALKKSKLIKLKAEKRVRGAVEMFYQATERSYIEPSEWPTVPDVVKGGLRGSLLDILMDDAIAAISKRTYDSLDGAHMSWTPVIIDEQGWEELVLLLLRTMETVIEINAESADRLVARDEKGISCTVSILGYPSAQKSRKVGPPADAQPATSTKRPKAKRKGASKKGTPKKPGQATTKGKAGKRGRTT